MLTDRDKPRLAILVVLALALWGYWEYHVSDVHRLSVFHAHRSDYETMLAMLQHDRGLTFINGGLTDPQDPATVGISAERIAEYRRYMSSVGCSAILWSVKSTLFVSDAAQAADILYFPNLSRGVSERTETRPRESRRIEGDWYLTSHDSL
jgi:hypothetical protein